MGWTYLIAQLWHVEVALLLWLVIALARRKDGRKHFEALMICSLVFDAAGLIQVRTGYMAYYANLAYLSYAVEAPLMAMALTEAADYKPLHHRRILFWWIAATVACLGIRYFPYSGRAMLLVNSLAYVAWIAEIRNRRLRN